MTREEWNQQYVAAFCQVLNDYTPGTTEFAQAAAEASEDWQDFDYYNDPEIAVLYKLFW